MGAGDQQAVAVEERAVIEEGESVRLVEDDRRIDLARGDRAEGQAFSGNDRQRPREDSDPHPLVLADVVAVDLDREGAAAALGIGRRSR